MNQSSTMMPRRMLVWAVLPGLLLVGGCLRDPMGKHAAARTEAFDLLTEGQKLKAQGDYLLARDLFLRGLAVSPRPVLYYEVGNCYYQLDRFDEAVGWFDRALEIEPTYVLASAERELAVSQTPAHGTERVMGGMAGPRDEAAPPESAAGKALPDDDETAQPELAPPPVPASLRESIFPELAVVQRTTTELHEGAETAIAESRFDDATRMLEQLQREGGMTAQSRVRLALSYEKTGRYRQAEDQLLAGLQEDPANAEAWHQLGNLMLTIKEEARAREAFSTAVELDPGNWRALNNRSVLQLNAGEYQAAAAGFRRLTELEPEFPAAWLNLALALDRSGEPAAVVLVALEGYIRRIERVPASTERWVGTLRKRVSGG